MMVQPAALYLTHFDQEPELVPGFDLGAAPDLAPIFVSPAEKEGEDREALLEAVRESGRAEGAEAARAEAEAEREQMREAFDAQLAAERQKWLEEQGEALQQSLATAAQQIREMLAESVGQVLRPFIVESLRRQMIDELIEHVTILTASHEALAVRITGPADLIQYLQGKLAALPVAIDYEAGEGVDVQVVAAQTVIETRLQAWIDLIRAQME